MRIIKRLSQSIAALMLALTTVVASPHAARASALDDLKKCMAVPEVAAKAGEQISEMMGDPFFQQCTAQVSGGDAIMIAVMAGLTALWGADNSIFQDEDGCKGLITTTLVRAFAKELDKLIKENPDFNNFLASIITQKGVDDLLALAKQEGADAIADAASQIPAVFMMYLNCGCKVAGTTAEVVKLLGEVSDNAEACQDLVSNPGQIFEDLYKDPLGTVGAIAQIYCDGISGGLCSKIGDIAKAIGEGVKDVVTFLGDACETTGLCELLGDAWESGKEAAKEGIECGAAVLTGGLFGDCDFGEGETQPPTGTTTGIGLGVACMPGILAAKWNPQTKTAEPPGCVCMSGSKLVKMSGNYYKCQCDAGLGYSFDGSKLQCAACSTEEQWDSAKGTVTISKVGNNGTCVPEVFSCAQGQKPSLLTMPSGQKAAFCSRVCKPGSVYDPDYHSNVAWDPNECSICAANTRQVGESCEPCAKHTSSKEGSSVCSYFKCTGFTYVSDDAPNQCSACPMYKGQPRCPMVGPPTAKWKLTAPCPSGAIPKPGGGCQPEISRLDDGTFKRKRKGFDGFTVNPRQQSPKGTTMNPRDQEGAKGVTAKAKQIKDKTVTKSRAPELNVGGGGGGSAIGVGGFGGGGGAPTVGVPGRLGR